MGAVGTAVGAVPFAVGLAVCVRVEAAGIVAGLAIKTPLFHLSILTKFAW